MELEVIFGIIVTCRRLIWAYIVLRRLDGGSACFSMVHTCGAPYKVQFRLELMSIRWKLVLVPSSRHAVKHKSQSSI